VHAQFGRVLAAAEEKLPQIAGAPRPARADILAFASAAQVRVAVRAEGGGYRRLSGQNACQICPDRVSAE